MYVFITPMPLEKESLLLNTKIIEEKAYGITEITLAEYEGKKFVLAKSGIGKVNAAMATQKAIDLYEKEIEGIIVVGVAGSLHKEKAPLFQAVIAKNVASHDCDTTAVGDPYGLVQTKDGNLIYFKTSELMNKHLLEASKDGVFENIISGDQFVADNEKKKWMKETFQAVAVEMESSAAAMVAYNAGIPFACLRTISDAENSADEYPVNAKKAALKAGEIARSFLSSF